MERSNERSKSPAETIQLLQKAFRYILSKWVLLVIIGVVMGTLGFIYASLQKPSYIAEITFAPESDAGGGLGGYAGLAAQFGFDIGGSSGGVFEGENLMEFLKSKLMIEQTLLTPAAIKGQREVLINYYIRTNKIDKDWDKIPSLKGFLFSENYTHGDRAKDSVLKVLAKNITEKVDIQKKDKKLNIVSAKMQDGDEYFAKAFIESLVNNGIQYYTNYRSGKSKQNVAILQRQADSVYSLMSGGITAVAAGTDLNINPIKQIVKANVQKKQIDVQINSKVYEEIVKQLELSKIMLRKETPFIQIIDTPILPLEKKKLSRLKSAIIFGFAGGFLALLFFIFKFSWRQYLLSIR